ncbi:MAG TPA: c-type cytochrome [Pyrinomonadaceae bacterium]|jgi:cytochrome c oxidase cbb3-type subunit 3|nr:c-type cytochrome [Pyrinomonadaceae bacterium]
MNRIKALLLCATVLSLTSLAAASGGPESQKSRRPADGRAVYANNCARCHGGDGTGQTTLGQMTEAPNLTDAGWQRGKGTSRMVASVANGRGQMPAFKKKLSRQEIAAAVAYVRTLKR